LVEKSNRIGWTRNVDDRLVGWSSSGMKQAKVIIVSVVAAVLCPSLFHVGLSTLTELANIVRNRIDRKQHGSPDINRIHGHESNIGSDIDKCSFGIRRVLE
jgi:hypothetical protein